MAFASSTLAIASLVAPAASTAVGVVSAVQQGQAQKDAANYQAQVAKNNAWLAEKQAQDTEDRGAEAERQHRVKVNQVLGAQRAAMAGQGADLSSGSTLDILGDTAATGTLDALTTRNNFDRDAAGLRAQGANYTAQAGLYEAQAKNAGVAGWLGASSSLLGGASSLGDKWAAYKTKGLL